MRPCLVSLILIAALAGACGSRESGSGNNPEGESAAPAATPIDAGGSVAGDVEWFSDVAARVGLDFHHFNGMSGRFYQPEIMAPGVALFDYDNDGDLDVYVVQGRMLGTGAPLIAPPPGGPPEDRLYRNDLAVAADGGRTLRFTDVTAQSGIHTRGYGMGVAAADIDNDGWIDLYVTGFGRNQMFRNNGDGTFADVSTASGTGEPEAWAVSASFFDYDRDGRLDLFVGSYLTYSLATHIPCFSAPGAPDYCRPSVYRPQPSHLYHNIGAGRFADVTIAAGMGRDFGPALGASAADFNGDGWTDLFVANDEHENQLWINQRDGTFMNTALPAGAALGPNGERKANMGVDAGDFDADGDEDLFVTELIAQGSSLYVNDGKGVFEEQSARLGVRGPTLPYTGFGAAWIDYDNDGWLDVMSVNGDVNENARDLNRKDNPFPLGQPDLLLRNLRGRFEDVTARAGTTFRAADASRGAAFGDIDNDGDTDVVVANGAGPLRLLLNNIGTRNHWIGLRLLGRPAGTAAAPRAPASSGGGARDMVGARVAILRSTGPTLWRRARADGSYASANDPRVLAGLGASLEKPRVRVTWPGGLTEEWTDVAVDRYTTLTEGSGR
jgi:enediyne biosynthesis protein E4